MRVSQYYRLGKTQAELDFVDVDIRNDTPVFISPRALHLMPSEWGEECAFLLRDFFQTVLKLIQTGKNGDAERLLGQLREPNETHLGLSQGKSQGRALGDTSAHDVWKALSSSVAAKSGLLRDLEDTILVIEGIDVDIISDMATNIIRGPLIAYTQEMANWQGIPQQTGVASGPIWNPTTHSWTSDFVPMPIAGGQKLLLVPKAIVRQSQIYRADEYYRHFLLEHLRAEEIKANTSLVHLLKDGTPKVYKKDLQRKYGQGKKAIVRETLKHPEVLEEYRKAKEKKPHVPLEQEVFSELEGSRRPDWDALLQRVLSTPTGKPDADRYEKAVEGLLTALFYPDLVYPKPQHVIHDGRKRVDIAYTNMAQAGFFSWVATHFPASHVFFECKNYGNEIGNPELDQLAGRFSPSRGQIGFLVCRAFDNKKRFLDRCKDTASDRRGFILALDDGDLRTLVDLRKSDVQFQLWPILQAQFTRLVS